MKIYTKMEIQKRVLLNGKSLPLESFSWDEKTMTFSTKESFLVLDFSELSNVTFDTGNSCTFKTGSYCTFNTGEECTFNTGWGCTFKTDSYCTFKTSSGCTFKTDSYCTFKTSSGCTFNTGEDCVFKTGWDCTFRAGLDCTFNTGKECTFKTSWGCTFKTSWGCTFETSSDCTFKTSSGCTFNTGWDCTFITGSDCTFKTGENCVFNAGSGCTFNTDSDCAIIRRDVFTVIQPNKTDTIQLFPYEIKGHSTNGIFNDKKVIVADGILSEIINQKGNTYKVINNNENEPSWLIKDGDNYSHGKTLKEAQESLVYKLSDRDTSKHNNLTLNSVLTKEEAIKAYMCITGACAAGTRYFVEKIENIKDEYNVKNIIDITKGQYGHNKFQQFFNKEQQKC